MSDTVTDTQGAARVVETRRLCPRKRRYVPYLFVVEGGDDVGLEHDPQVIPQARLLLPRQPAAQNLVQGRYGRLHTK